MFHLCSMPCISVPCMVQLCYSDVLFMFHVLHVCSIYVPCLFQVPCMVQSCYKHIDRLQWMVHLCSGPCIYVLIYVTAMFHLWFICCMCVPFTSHVCSSDVPCMVLLSYNNSDRLQWMAEVSSASCQPPKSATLAAFAANLPP